MTAPAATATTSSPGPSLGPVARFERIIVVLLPAVMIAIGGWVHRWTDEDAFINFRVVDQIFAGHGPVFNAGERVEVTTSTVWVAALTAGRAALGWAVGMEWLSVGLGLAAAILAFWIAASTSRRCFTPNARIVPVGLIAVAAVPVMWDFATSGLEMGLVWLWIACCWLALTRVAVDAIPSTRARRVSLIAIGLGPLVRPDLAVMSVAFLAAWILLASPRRVTRDLVTALALPVAYQVFRMGYYANIVPNTALAKDSGGLHVGQGWRYLKDLVGTYSLWIPMAAVVVVIALRLIERHDRRTVIATGALVLGATLHAGYIVGSGGDYMHGRLLLPSLFAVAVPATVELTSTRGIRRVLTAGAVGIVAVWSVVVIAGVRYTADRPTVFGVADISDWRILLGKQIYHHTHKSLTVSDYQLRAYYAAGRRGYMRVLDFKPRPGRDPHKLVVTLGSIGVPAWVAGHNVFVVDVGGLAEPLAARSAPVAGRAAGHRKVISPKWYDARFGVGGRDPRTVAARHALRCGAIKDLLASVDEPITPSRFLSNLWEAVPNTFIHIPSDPRVAERKYC